MKILLVNPPKYKNVEYVREGRCMQPKSVWNSLWPPLSLNYLATLLEKKNEVKLTDYIAENKDFDDLKEELKQYSPDAIIINNGFPSIKGDMKVASIAKEINKKIITITYGIFPTILPKETLNKYPIDYIALGESEITIQELIETIKTKQEISKIKGLAFKEKDQIVFTEKRELIKDLDKELGFPNRELILNEKYVFPFDKKPFALVLLTRGCPYKCTFCVAPMYYGNKLRIRDPKTVVDELEQCYKKYNIQNFIFWGESFTLNQNYGLAICDEILKRNLKFKWITTSRVDTLNLNLLKQMKKAGCYLLGLGIETANDEILKNVNKLTTTKKIKEAINLCKQAGIKTMGHFIFGFPGETKKTAEKTIKFAKSCGIDYAQFYCSIPYPKTEYWKQIKNKKQILSKNWDLYEQNYSIIKTDELTPEDLMAYRTKAFKKFYFRPKLIIKHLKSLSSPKEIWNTIVSSLEVLKWFVPKKK